MQKYIPKPARTGRPRSNDRVTINGIMFVLVTGCRWREMPEKYGSKSTAHRRLQNWQPKESMEKYSVRCNKICIQIWQSTTAEDIS